ncbi:MAG TPA: hypothetical protein VMT43_13685, partial [Acidimicrobiales bacterium]|nr:hypothetical protein [Acidimicrobiales bacterium]
ASILVRVYVDGRSVLVLTAGGTRNDVATAFPGYGAAHGFDGSVNVAGGRHSVCVHAVNRGAGNADTNLGCRST